MNSLKLVLALLFVSAAFVEQVQFSKETLFLSSRDLEN